jgi:hypothetical protein
MSEIHIIMQADQAMLRPLFTGAASVQSVVASRQRLWTTVRSPSVCIARSAVAFLKVAHSHDTMDEMRDAGE